VSFYLSEPQVQEERNEHAATTDDELFSQVETITQPSNSSAKAARASWRGTLSLNLPSLGLGSVEYHLRAAKVHGDLKQVEFHRVETDTGREVVVREVPKLYRYSQGPDGEKQDYQEIPYDETKEKVRYGEYHVTAKNERRFFLKDELETEGKWIEVHPSKIADKQTEDDEEIQAFERTTKILVEPDDFVPRERLTEYKFKDFYLLSADTDKKVRESTERVRQLARHLLDKQSALVAFFSWGRGYQYYTAVIFPYERGSDGRLWLLMGLSEGVLRLDEAWSLEANPESAAAEPLPFATARKKKTPKVSISK
jgi:hypothetical protein